MQYVVKLSTVDFSLAIKKGKVRPRTGHEGPEEGVEVQLYSFLNLSARWGWMGNATPRPLNARGGDTVSLVQKAGWAPSP
jgi:hypothetical protein